MRKYKLNIALLAGFLSASTSLNGYGLVDCVVGAFTGPFRLLLGAPTPDHEHFDSLAGKATYSTDNPISLLETETVGFKRSAADLSSENISKLAKFLGVAPGLIDRFLKAPVESKGVNISSKILAETLNIDLATQNRKERKIVEKKANKALNIKVPETVPFFGGRKVNPLDPENSHLLDADFVFLLHRMNERSRALEEKLYEYVTSPRISCMTFKQKISFLELLKFQEYHQELFTFQEIAEIYLRKKIGNSPQEDKMYVFSDSSANSQDLVLKTRFSPSGLSFPDQVYSADLQVNSFRQGPKTLKNASLIFLRDKNGWIPVDVRRRRLMSFEGNLKMVENPWIQPFFGIFGGERRQLWAEQNGEIPLNGGVIFNDANKELSIYFQKEAIGNPKTDFTSTVLGVQFAVIIGNREHKAHFTFNGAHRFVQKDSHELKDFVLSLMYTMLKAPSASQDLDLQDKMEFLTGFFTKDIEDKIYQIRGKCYKYVAEPTVCNSSKKIVHFE